MDAGFNGICDDDDRAGPGIFLRWLGEKKERACYHDAVVLCIVPDKYSVDTMGVYAIFWS